MTLLVVTPVLVPLATVVLTAMAHGRPRLQQGLSFAGIAVFFACAVGLVGAAALVVAIGVGTGRLDVPPPPGVRTDLAGIATPDGGRAGGLVVWIANGSGDEDMTAEVARLARMVGIHGVEVAAAAAPAAETRILVHRDTPHVVAAAADLFNL